MFKESEGGQESIVKINKNFKALKSLDKGDISSLSKVIENSIVFTLSKQGRFSKFKNSSQESNVALRRRKIMIGMAQDTFAHRFQTNQSDIIEDSSDEDDKQTLKYKMDRLRAKDKAQPQVMPPSPKLNQKTNTEKPLNI